MVGTRRRSGLPTDLKAEADETSAGGGAKSTPSKMSAISTPKSVAAAAANKPSSTAAARTPATPAGGGVRRSRRVSEIGATTTEAATEESTPPSRRATTRSATPTVVAANPDLEKVKDTAALTKVRTPRRAKESAATTPSVATPTAKRGRGRTPAKTTDTSYANPADQLEKPSVKQLDNLKAESRPAAVVATSPRSKRLSETVQETNARPATPTRKSRRLSGSVPELEDSPQISLPLKKRRTSICSDTDTPTKTSAKEVEPPKSTLPDIKEAAEESPKKADSAAATKKEPAVAETTEAAEIEPAFADTVSAAPEADSALTKDEKAASEAVNTDEGVTETAALDIIEEIDEEAADHDVEMADAKTIETSSLTGESVVSREASDKATSVKESKPLEPSDKEMKILTNLQQMLIKNIPRQKPKSGKFWKEGRSQFRQIKKDKRKNFEARLRLKEDKKRVQDLENQIKQNKLEKRMEIVKRIEENKKLKEERQLKSEVYQVVKNPNKIKRMKKRDLAKRDILGKI